MGEALNVGIIGTGLIAREHAQAIAMLRGGVRLVAACDVAPERVKKFSEDFGIPRRYARPEDLIADPAVQLVAIATPPSAHEEAVVAALAAGKYVLCEKPLAHSLASARRIAAAAERFPGRLSVSHQMRYHPGYRRLVWLARNGALGSPLEANLARHGQTQGGGWWGAWDTAGGGVLITQLIHEVDVLLQAMGPAISVRARMDTRYSSIESEDNIEAAITFPGGVAHCSASVNSGRPGGQFRISGPLGSATPADFNASDRSHRRQSLAAVHAAIPETRPPSASRAATLSRRIARKAGLPGRPELVPHARLYEDIAGCIARGQALPIPAHDAIASLELCMAAYESALTGREVTLPLGADALVSDGVRKEIYDARIGRGPQVAARGASPIRIGIVGLDTSHAPTFTKLLHDPGDALHIPGARVTAAYPGGSADMPISITRVPGFTAELRDRFGVRIVDSPEQAANASDVVLLVASDGRTHPALFKAVAGRGKPVLVDKPFAVSVADAREIFRVADATGTPVFASSAFRYADGLAAVLTQLRARGERVRTCHVQCWLPIEPTQGRYFWYGIHAAEMLVACMGAGAAEVTASGREHDDLITVRYEDGREAIIAGSRKDGAFRVRLATDRQDWDIDLGGSMHSLSARLLWTALDVLAGDRFPRLWRATDAGSVAGRTTKPLDPTRAETLDVIGLLEAAQQSYELGRPVRIAHEAEKEMVLRG